jgi:hypothetical protein
MAKACGATRLRIFGDSNLVVHQVMNRCDALCKNMTTYRNYLEGTFDRCEVSHISRASNKEANVLANIGSQCLPIPPGVFWEEIVERSIQGTKPSGMKKQKPQSTSDLGDEITAEDDSPEPEEVMMIEVTWMQLYLAYMLNKTLPEDVFKAWRIMRQSIRGG